MREGYLLKSSIVVTMTPWVNRSSVLKRFVSEQTWSSPKKLVDMIIVENLTKLKLTYLYVKSENMFVYVFMYSSLKTIVI